MERQAKERLVGAAVLVAAAIILVPEMLSGPKDAPQKSNAKNDAPAAGMAPSAAIKTYSVDLNQTAQPAAQAPPPEAAPAAAESGAAATEPMEAAPPVPEPEKKTENKKAEAKLEAKPTEKTAVIANAAAEKKPPSGSGAWIVQVGSFAAEGKADSLAQELNRQGFKAFVKPVTVNGKTLYRVRIGSAGERSAAEAMLAKLKTTQPAASVVPQ